MAKSNSSKGGGGREKKSSSKSGIAADSSSTTKAAAAAATGGADASKRQQGTDGTTTVVDGNRVDLAASQFLYSWVVYGLCVYFTCIILYNAYKIRMHAIKEYGPVIHEFDPYFNYRATEVSSSKSEFVFWGVSVRSFNCLVTFRCQSKR